MKAFIIEQKLKIFIFLLKHNLKIYSNCDDRKLNLIEKKSFDIINRDVSKLFVLIYYLFTIV